MIMMMMLFCFGLLSCCIVNKQKNDDGSVITVSIYSMQTHKYTCTGLIVESTLPFGQKRKLSSNVLLDQILLDSPFLWCIVMSNDMLLWPLCL